MKEIEANLGPRECLVYRDFANQYNDLAVDPAMHWADLAGAHQKEQLERLLHDQGPNAQDADAMTRVIQQQISGSREQVQFSFHVDEYADLPELVDDADDMPELVDSLDQADAWSVVFGDHGAHFVRTENPWQFGDEGG